MTRSITEAPALKMLKQSKLKFTTKKSINALIYIGCKFGVNKRM